MSTGVVECNDEVKVGKVKDVTVKVREGHTSTAARYARTVLGINRTCVKRTKKKIHNDLLHQFKYD